MQHTILVKNTTVKQADLNSTLSAAKDYLQSGAGAVQEFASANPTLAAMLLAGGGAGLVGGALTAKQPEVEGEAKSDRRKRILRNALLSAAGGAGAVGLGASALNRFATAVPSGSKGPIEQVAESALGRSAVSGAASTIARGSYDYVALRQIRKQLNNLLVSDPDAFTDSQIKNILQQGNVADLKKAISALPQTYNRTALENIVNNQPVPALTTKAQQILSQSPASTISNSSILRKIFSKLPSSIRNRILAMPPAPAGVIDKVPKILGASKSGQMARLAALLGFFYPEELEASKAVAGTAVDVLD